MNLFTFFGMAMYVFGISYSTLIWGDPGLAVAILFTIAALFLTISAEWNKDEKITVINTHRNEVKKQ